MDARVLFIGLTTVFAWTPAFILLLLALFGLVSAVVNIAEVPLYLTLALILVGLGGVSGFLALSSICWGLKLRPVTRQRCLIFGVLTMLLVIISGAVSQSELLHIGFNLVDMYIFIGPLIFGSIHIVLHYLSYRKVD
ncbi:MAG: hypothetical protein ACI808_002454 [Paraglaciecola sp.]|jgi:hypothetical protein